MAFSRLLIVASLLTIGYCCSIPYVPVGNQCLFFGSLTFDYETSAEVCGDLNGRLVKIDDTQKLLDILQYINNDTSATHSYWVNGNDAGGSWGYSDGIDIPLGTPYWATFIDQDQNYQQHPVDTNMSEENCLAMRSDTSFFFTSNDCSELYIPLCEEITGSSSISVQSSCGGSLNMLYGDIMSPNYPSGSGEVDCIWDITTTDDSVLWFTITDFDCYPDDNNHMEIRDGPSISSPLLGSWYGYQSTPFKVQTSQNQAWVRYKTNYDNIYKGWNMQWTSEWRGEWDGDCTIDYNTATGSFHSPMYPVQYPKNLNCYYTITVDEGSIIRLSVVSFDTEGSPDPVEIRDGPYSSSPLISTLSGHSVATGYEVTSTTNRLYVSFTSDSTITGEGFSFMWTSEELCPTPYLNVGQMCLHFQFSSLTNGQAGIACEEESGQLAYINDAQDLRDLYSYLQNKGIADTSFWLGASDAEEEGLWKWSDGSNVPTGTPFWGTTGYYSDIQEPEGGEAENCLLLLSQGFHYFRDESCDFMASAICMHLA